MTPTSIELTFVPKLARKARLRFDRHSGGHMIIYPERGLALNESAAAIAKLCDGTRTVAAIVGELATEAGVPSGARDDIIASHPSSRARAGAARQ